MPPSVAVVSDSACDLPSPTAERAGVAVVPLLVTFGSESFRDGVDLSLEEFWSRVEAGPPPTTASPSIGALHQAYGDAADRGASGVISVHLSGALSGTVNTARQAAVDAPLPVEVVDSGTVSAAEGLVALAAARAAAHQGSLAEVALIARSTAARLRIAAVLDSVEFLARGGRMAGAAAAMAGTLRIRPVLTMRGGEPAVHSRARTGSRAIDDAVDLVARPAEAVAVFHTGAPEARDVALRLGRIAGGEPLIARARSPAPISAPGPLVWSPWAGWQRPARRLAGDGAHGHRRAPSGRAHAERPLPPGGRAGRRGDGHRVAGS